ncbi:hypothetical protein [Ancylobacter sp. SL191]|jgi:hypothetical protein|uniref:hypothetical protein n=1 Tax=Ancylobacter sp. SL191 TaxID=2995166 RepID=UPI00226E33AD|nr:hypothetical protein [Ancylobacter sp. SL191]WAC29233.1 hypothetical protein OU996_09490 [Ancylobacter sp. SL191]
MDDLASIYRERFANTGRETHSLAYTINDKTRTRGPIIRTYRTLPIAWGIFGKPHLALARKRSAS